MITFIIIFSIFVLLVYTILYEPPAKAYLVDGNLEVYVPTKFSESKPTTVYSFNYIMGYDRENKDLYYCFLESENGSFYHKNYAIFPANAVPSSFIGSRLYFKLPHNTRLNIDKKIKAGEIIIDNHKIEKE